jgi:uncharacterized membrane protein
MIPTSHFHPMLVHFPIALLVIGFMAEVFYLFLKKEHCLSQTGFYLLIVGSLAAVAAFLSGRLFTGEMSGEAGQVRDTHALLAFTTMIVSLVAAAFRVYLKATSKESKPLLKWIALCVYLIIAVLISITGFFGGNLVYNYMMPL